MACSYRDLVVWQKALTFVTEIYRVTGKFPDNERYGLVSQLRRAAVSIPSNIAEGQGRLTEGEFRQFLGHARGSLLEVETQLLIAQELGFLDSVRFVAIEEHSKEIGRLLNGLIGSDLSRPANRFHHN
jgi:four helix bundle protein